MVRAGRFAAGLKSVSGAVQRLLWACERDPELLRHLRDEWGDSAGGAIAPDTP